MKKILLSLLTTIGITCVHATTPTMVTNYQVHTNMPNSNITIVGQFTAPEEAGVVFYIPNILLNSSYPTHVIASMIEDDGTFVTGCKILPPSPYGNAIFLCYFDKIPLHNPQINFTIHSAF